MQFYKLSLNAFKRAIVSVFPIIVIKSKTPGAEALPNNARIIALEIEGKSFSSEELALKITQLQQTSSHLCFIVGGPEGLSAEILKLSDERWSL